MEKEKKQELLRTLKFTLFSVSAGIIQILSYTLMVEVFHWDNEHKLTWLSNLISLILSVLWNFTFNRKFTFKSAANVPIAMLKVAAFYAIFSPVSALCTKFLSGKAGTNILSKPFSWCLIWFWNISINASSFSKAASTPPKNTERNLRKNPPSRKNLPNKPTRKKQSKPIPKINKNACKKPPFRRFLIFGY